MCRDKKSKVRSTELEHCSCQYEETRYAKASIQKSNTTDVNIH